MEDLFNSDYEQEGQPEQSFTEITKQVNRAKLGDIINVEGVQAASIKKHSKGIKVRRSRRNSSEADS